MLPRVCWHFPVAQLLLTAAGSHPSAATPDLEGLCQVANKAVNISMVVSNQ